MRSLAVVPVALALVGCGSASMPPAPAPAPAAAVAHPAAPPPAPLGDHALARSAVHDAVTQGLGAFLQRLELDDLPVFAAGKFHGFRIAALRGDAFWNGVDLKPGDVVTRVNGFPIEHPEQAETAFESLEVSSELRVDYERDGHARELVYAIVDGR